MYIKLQCNINKKNQFKNDNLSYFLLTKTYPLISIAFWEDELRFLSDMSANLAKSVSWSISRADFLDSNTRTSSNFFITSMDPYKRK